MAHGTRRDLEIDCPMLMGGEDIFTPLRIEVRNPARPSEVVGRIGRAGPQEVDKAVAAARAAQPGWARLSHRERAGMLEAALEAVDRKADSLASLYVRENGKIRAEAERELRGVLPRQKLLLSTALQLDAEKELQAPGGRTFVGYRPFGVVVSIVPWNSPISLGFAQIVAALATGNAVVLKPPETCPLALSLLARTFARALPDGLVNVVTGLPGEIGERLTTHPDVGKIAFTGSIPSARRIIECAASGITNLTLELGGNDAAIVLDDGILDPALMERFAAAAYTMTGQVCMAIKRAYVHRPVAERFTDALAAAMDRTVVGNGLDPQTTMGPLHTRAALDRATALLADARAQGARVRTLGRLSDGAAPAEGYFLQPAIVTRIEETARLVREEQFCPLLPILAFDDPEEAMARANATVFGLGGSVWSRDPSWAAGLARRLEAGTVFVNTHGTGAVNRNAPYGGMKQSGMGRKSGLSGLLEFIELQTLTMAD